MKNEYHRRAFCLLLALVFVLVCPMNGVAQETRLFTTAIDNHSANTFCQDKFGFMWIGTEHGLYRFDGVDFRQYLHEEGKEGTLADDAVNVLYSDSEGCLWVGTAGGLQYYRPERDDFQQITVKREQAAADGYVTSVVRRRNGEVWFVASGLGVLRVEKDMRNAVRLMDRSIYTNVYATQLYEDGQSNLWISDQKQGVWRVDSQGREKRYDLSAPLFMLEDKEGRLLVVCEGTVVYWDEQADQMCTLPAHTNYLYGSTGVYNACLLSRAQLPLERPQATCVYEDSHRNLWVNCQGQGVLMIHKRTSQFSFCDFSSSGLNRAKAVLCDEGGRIWCALSDEGIVRLDADGTIATSISTPSPATALHKDGEGRLWAGLEDGTLCLIDTEHRSIVRRIHLPMKNSISSIVSDKQGVCYVAVFGEGLVCYDTRSGEMRTVSMESPGDRGRNLGCLVNNWMTTLMLDSRQRLWMGHFGGISCYDTRGQRVLDVEKVLGFGISNCHSLLESADGTVWLGTNHGLYALTDGLPDKIRHWTTAQGLSDNTICGLGTDAQDGIWCSTMKGICRLQPESDEIRHYYSGGGLLDRSYTQGVYAQGADGTVCFGGVRGVTSFLPEHVGDAARMDCHVFVTDMLLHDQHVTQQTLSGGRSVIDKPLVEADDITLANDDNSFVLRLSTMDFREPGNVVYQYRLAEVGEEWCSTQPGENMIRFNHLEHGHYTFEVRAQENGAFSAIRKLGITILPPWYLTWWAKSLCVLLVMAVAVLALLLAQRRQRKCVNEERPNLFTSISSGIRPVKMQNIDQQLLDRVVAYINENIGNSDLDMEMLAAHVGLSRVHLYRRIKELTGETPSQFLRNLRLKQAAILLRQHNSNIAQVAYAVGFSNPNHFATCFKNAYGITPTEYIKRGEGDV